MDESYLDNDRTKSNIKQLADHVLEIRLSIHLNNPFLLAICFLHIQNGTYPFFSPSTGTAALIPPIIQCFDQTQTRQASRRVNWSSF